MLANRSIPSATVLPVLAYADVNEAAAWLCAAFGFTVRLRIADHRIQLNVGNGAIILRELHPNELSQPLGLGHSVLIRVEDADSHCADARQHGVRIMQEPTTQAYGERQYKAQDLAGHFWDFSQSIADIHPSDWGGTAEHL